MKRSLNILLLSFSLLGCTKLNENAPNYIKDVVALKEGSEGIKVYFVLCDVLGNMTTADGTVYLRIYQSRDRYSDIRDDGTLYERTFTVKKSEFQQTQVGLGLFQRDAIVYLVGRIDYSFFSKYPTASTGTVGMAFTTSKGEILRGNTSIIF
jgi:hypothetical protein